MIERLEIGGLKVAKPLYDLVKDEIVPGIGIDPDAFWNSFGEIVRELAPRNRDLLAKRDALQAELNAWHREHRAQPLEMDVYRAYLSEVGYLVPEGPDFLVSTTNVDPEIAAIAGPQLVVPLSNARYALNAVNARWGSLYGALYGTDAIPEQEGLERGADYNPQRGAAVVADAAAFLDATVPLNRGSYGDACGFKLEQGKLVVCLPDNSQTMLTEPAQFIGYRGSPEQVAAILFVNHGLHIEIQIDREHAIGKEAHPVSRTFGWNPPSPVSRTARIPSPRSTRRTRSGSIVTGSG